MKTSTAVLALFIAAFVAGADAGWPHGRMTVDLKNCDTVADVAAKGNFTLLLAAVEAANLTSTFTDPMLMATVFAPTDEAFLDAIDALNTTAEAVFADTDLLTAVLTTHVVDGLLGLESWMVKSLNPGQVLSIEPTVSAANTAEITTPGIRACLSIVYPISAVLLPEMN